jgi:hypothetical protein
VAVFGGLWLLWCVVVGCDWWVVVAVVVVAVVVVAVVVRLIKLRRVDNSSSSFWFPKDSK